MPAYIERMAALLKWCCVFILLSLVACSTPMAPVSERGTNLRQPESEYRSVVAGDTLYSISWESGRDYRDVARWSNISPPYVIKPGQRLRLYPPPGAGQWEPITPPEIASSQPKQTVKSNARKTKPSTKSPASSVQRSTADAGKQISWIWPTQGMLLGRFTANGPNKGINIAGKKGQPILAAASGQVVYQGGGLRGYGQLIIIKHSNDFLSAYAHCDKIYVKEGNVIKRGQKIADMGNTGADRVMLHFEIRFRGAPVDPQGYLPKK